MSTGCYKFSRYKTGKLEAAVGTNSSGSSSNAKTDSQQAAAATEATTGEQASSSEDAKPVLLVPPGDLTSVLSMAESFYWVSLGIKVLGLGLLGLERSRFWRDSRAKGRATVALTCCVYWHVTNLHAVSTS
jgi:hypothetical protein